MDVRPVHKPTTRKPATAPAVATTQRNPPTPACAVRKVRGMGPLKRKNGRKRKSKKRKEKVQDVLAVTSPTQSTRPAWPPGFPPRPRLLPVSRPDNSRKRNRRLSQRGLFRSTRMLPGCLPSHASARAARDLALGHGIWSSCARGRTSNGRPPAS